MTRTFKRYAVSAVLVVAAAIALWGIRNAIYAQQEEAATASPVADSPVANAPIATSPSNEQQLGLAMLNYAEEHGKFPPAAVFSSNGKPLLSWRVLILPYLGDDAKHLYSQFHLDERWDSPANEPLLEKMPRVFSTPIGVSRGPYSTCWRVFTGTETIFASAEGIPFSDIHDGLSNTILIAESDHPVPWTEPADLPFASFITELDIHHGFRVVMADGTVRKVPPSFPVEKLKEFITRKGNEHALDTSVLTQFDVWAPERHENNPNLRQQPSPQDLNQSFRRAGAAGPSLEQQVRQEFDARQTSLRQQIKDFSERLQRLSVLVDERDRAKEAIIQRRVDELRNPNLRWEAADQAASGSNRSQQPLAAVGNTDRPADEAKPKVAAETFPLRHIKPDRVIKVLIEDFHGSAGIQLSQTSDSIKVAGVPGDLDRIRALVKNLDVAPPAGDEASATVAELDGLWEAILPPDLADTVPVEKRLKLVFYKNMHATFIGKTLQTACTFSVTPSASPKRIALHGNQPKRGLYEVSGDGLRLSIAPADAAFPTRFGTEKAEFKRINNAVPQEMLDAITSHLQDTTWSKRAGNRLSEPESNPLGGGNKMRRQQEVQKETEKALLKKVDANFENCPLNEVLDYIAGVAEVNVYIDEVALRAEGVTSDRPITINLKQPIALRSLLNQILSPLRLTYVVENDVLKITNEKAKGSSAPVQADAVQPDAVELPNPDPVAVLWQRSPNDLHSDVAWVRNNVKRTRKAMDRQLAELKRSKPEASDSDVEQADKATWNAWNAAKVQHDLLFEKLAQDFARVESSWTACRAQLEDERANLHRLEHGPGGEGDLPEQRQLVESLRVREQQLATLRNLYNTLNDSGYTSVRFPTPHATKPGWEIADDLRKVGIDARPTTFKSISGDEERNGLLVATVYPDRPAAKAGLQTGDIIVAAHVWETASLRDLWCALSYVYTPRDDTTLFDIKVWVWRNDQYISVHLPPFLSIEAPNKAAKGSSESVQPNATPNATDPSGVLLLRSANDFQADLAWARSNANKAGKARDAWIAEAKKTSPDATERDVDPTLLDQWQTANERLDFLRNEFASQMKLIDSALETCQQEIATEQERLAEMERTLVPGSRTQYQRKVVAKAELRVKQILTLRDLYEKVNEFPSTTVVPNDVKLPGAVEMENDLRQQIGLDLSTGTVKASQGEEERKVLVVAAVRADSPAAKAGLQEMDLIVAAHIWQIASPENLWYVLSRVGSTRTNKPLEEIKVWVRRNGQDVSVRLPPIEHKW